MAVARITQVIGASPHSWEDAIRNALERANKTLRGITGIEVLKENAAVESGKIAEYRATVQVTFALDAAFLYLERSGQLLHVAGIYTVEGRLDFEQLMRDLDARLHLIPRYTQRVVSVPLSLAHPT